MSRWVGAAALVASLAFAWFMYHVAAAASAPHAAERIHAEYVHNLILPDAPGLAKVLDQVPGAADAGLWILRRNSDSTATTVFHHTYSDGRVVIDPDGHDLVAVVRHEYGHLLQLRRWGPDFGMRILGSRQAVEESADCVARQLGSPGGAYTRWCTLDQQRTAQMLLGRS